jgi:protein SCO1/2
MNLIKSPPTFIKALFISVIAALALLTLVIWYAQKKPVIGGDFQLNFRGQQWKFDQNKKQINLLYVGYAKCPDVCPMSLSHSAQAFLKLTADELNLVQLIFVSVDHENDTAANVADYAAQFFPHFIGLTGTKQQIDFTVNLFGASYILEKNPKSYIGYSIAHTDRIFILNNKGILIDSISSPRSADEIYNKIKENL